MLQVASFLGVGNYIAEKIVRVIQVYGWGIVLFSIIASILSMGGLSVTQAIIEFIVARVEYLLARYGFARAVLW